MTRSYDDGCGIAHALDLVGERWALLVVRELLLGPKRFTDLRAGLPGVSANILSQRLRELEAEGIVERTTLPPPAAAAVYALTARGAELEPVVLALGAWGVRSPTLPRDAHLGVDSVILSLAAQLTRTDPPATYELRLGAYRFAVRLHDGTIDVSRGPAERPAAVISTTARTLDAVVSGDRTLTDAVASGEATVDGDEDAAARFATYFAPA
ncbi:winged helix-turn-helix transcriptional regulator [Cellulomonas terrae]|uniref:Transcriptional regulator n=1 Tax=Cellulomonas terrae TaxID=311234 RepID=A0A511JL56_9CELL|nr:helix-turn-helix domain-containing protein [Cellulomonas terrae]GEL98686.1 transcriptional regulator [Cellulomonas terrae]